MSLPSYPEYDPDMGQVSWSTEWKTYYQDKYEKLQYKTGRLAYPTNGDRV